MNNIARYCLYGFGALMAGIGTWILITPAAMKSAHFITVMALTLVLYGVVELYVVHIKSSAAAWLLPSGLIISLMGDWIVLAMPKLAATPQTQALIPVILPFIFAFILIGAGIIRINGSLLMKAQGVPIWGYICGFGTLGMTLGLLFIFSHLIALPMAIGLTFLWLFLGAIALAFTTR